MSKRIVISGGSRGIGKACAQVLSAAGYQVLAPSSREMDVSSQTSVSDFFRANFQSDSDLYALICNAGVFQKSALETSTLEDWQKIIDINLTGSFLASKYALPYLKNSATGAHIIMISSVSAEGEAYAAAYSASKAGQQGLCKALAQELAKDNINVNCIAPGWVRTDMAQSILHNKELEQNNLGANLQNRWIEPEEIAHTVEYLISDSAKAITGEVLTVSAGL